MTCKEYVSAFQNDSCSHYLIFPRVVQVWLALSN